MTVTYDLSGKVALVTGAAGGMGRAIVRAFAEAGADVVAGDLVDDTRLAADTEGLPGAVHLRIVDVSDAASVEALVLAATEGFGRLDLAVNAAAVEFETAPLADCEDADFDTMMAVNARGVFLGMKHELRAMVAQGDGGAIVNIASTNSFRPQANQPAYTASKHAVLGLTRSAAVDYARHGIRVNAICPGAIDTPMLRNAIERRRSDADEVARRLSLFGRFGKPDEIAQATLYLCSSGSTFVTGHALVVDGGMLC